jgi:hypothetical protein
MIKLTETRKITPYVWVHPDDGAVMAGSKKRPQLGEAEVRISKQLMPRGPAAAPSHKSQIQRLFQPVGSVSGLLTGKPAVRSAYSGMSESSGYRTCKCAVRFMTAASTW